MIKTGEYYKACSLIKMWNDWLFDKGAVEKAAEKHEIKNKFDYDEFNRIYEEARKGSKKRRNKANS